MGLSRSCSLVVLGAILSTLVGCRSLDRTQGHIGPAPTCSVHGCEMHPEEMLVAGEIVYVRDYHEVAATDFPNHGEHRYNGETADTPYGRRVIDWVCPECHRLYLEYWESHSGDG
jgi:hypothetical protein